MFLSRGQGCLSVCVCLPASTGRCLGIVSGVTDKFKQNCHLPAVPPRTLAGKPQDSRFLEGIKSKEEGGKKNQTVERVPENTAVSQLVSQAC